MENQVGENIITAPKAKKSQGKLTIVLLVIMSAMLIAVLTMLVLTMKENKENNKRIDELSASVKTVSDSTAGMDKNITEANEKLADVTEFIDQFSSKLGVGYGETTENDVTIGMEYKILSTEKLSDAYKAGDWSSLEEQEQKTIELADAVIKEVIKEGMTDYEKELAIYEWIHQNITVDDGITVAIPTTGEYADNPYGVLMTKKAVCVGFATTFRLFMQMLDIDCMVVHDTGLSHSWNLIKLDDEWYHVDNYMDNGGAKYMNFNMTDSMCGMGHEWDREFFPAANGTEYSYMLKNCVEFKSLEEFAKDLREIIEGEESKSITYKVTTDDFKTTAAQLELIAEGVKEYQGSSELAKAGYFEYAVVSMDDTALYYNVSFSYNGNSLEDVFTEAGKEQILNDVEKVMDKVFGDFYDEHEQKDNVYEKYENMGMLF